METPKRPKRTGKILLWTGLSLCALIMLGFFTKVLRLERDGTVIVQTGELFALATATPEAIEATVAPTTEVTEETPPPTPTPSPTPIPTDTPAPQRHPKEGDSLLVGDVAPAVVDISIRLMTLDYLTFEQPTEQYMEGTASAVSDFQRRNGLSVTGICDPTTYEVLFSEEALPYALVKGATGEEVELVKERLYELGYLETTDFTTYDEETETAVRLFRERNGLGSEVILDDEAFEVLLGNDTVANYYSIGDRSDEIKHYQELLYRKGYLTYAPDGVFGTQTQNAVRRFQEQNGLVVDGCLGKSTKALLDSGKGDKFDFTIGMEGEDVRRIQNRLAHYGYLKDSQVTGYYGEKTQAAVKAFQKRNSVSADGKVGYNTISKLFSDKAKKAAASSSGGGSSGGNQGDSGTPSGSTIQYGEGKEAFIKVAKSKLGCKYVRGGKGPNTFDCSGFVYWCLKQVGVNQSYMTSIAWRSCTKYQRIGSMSDIKRGDVLVFKGSSMSKGHVGIYLGNGEMIDASSGAGKVRITDTVLSGSYWKNHFLMAYRIWD